jgi:hypothetical protein
VAAPGFVGGWCFDGGDTSARFPRRRRAAARRAPKPGQRGSRRWRQHRRRQQAAEARHQRRECQAQHEAAKALVGWAVQHRAGTLAVGDPRGAGPGPGRGAAQPAGPRLADRAPDPRPVRQAAGRRDHRHAGRRAGHIVDLPRVCPAGAQARRAGLFLPQCGQGGHRDLVAAANIAAHAGGGSIPPRQARGSRTAGRGVARVTARSLEYTTVFTGGCTSSADLTKLPGASPVLQGGVSPEVATESDLTRRNAHSWCACSWTAVTGGPGENHSTS